MKSIASLLVIAHTLMLLANPVYASPITTASTTQDLLGQSFQTIDQSNQAEAAKSTLVKKLNFLSSSEPISNKSLGPITTLPDFSEDIWLFGGWSGYRIIKTGQTLEIRTLERRYNAGYYITSDSQILLANLDTGDVANDQSQGDSISAETSPTLWVSAINETQKALGFIINSATATDDEKDLAQAVLSEIDTIYNVVDSRELTINHYSHIRGQNVDTTVNVERLQNGLVVVEGLYDIFVEDSTNGEGVPRTPQRYVVSPGQWTVGTQTLDGPYETHEDWVQCIQLLACHTKAGEVQASTAEQYLNEDIQPVLLALNRTKSQQADTGDQAFIDSIIGFISVAGDESQVERMTVDVSSDFEAGDGPVKIIKQGNLLHILDGTYQSGSNSYTYTTTTLNVITNEIIASPNRGSLPPPNIVDDMLSWFIVLNRVGLEIDTRIGEVEGILTDEQKQELEYFRYAKQIIQQVQGEQLSYEVPMDFRLDNGVVVQKSVKIQILRDGVIRIEGPARLFNPDYPYDYQDGLFAENWLINLNTARWAFYSREGSYGLQSATSRPSSFGTGFLNAIQPAIDALGKISNATQDHQMKALVSEVLSGINRGQRQGGSSEVTYLPASLATNADIQTFIGLLRTRGLIEDFNLIFGASLQVSGLTSTADKLIVKSVLDQPRSTLFQPVLGIDIYRMLNLLESAADLYGALQADAQNNVPGLSALDGFNAFHGTDLYIIGKPSIVSLTTLFGIVGDPQYAGNPNTSMSALLAILQNSINLYNELRKDSRSGHAQAFKDIFGIDITQTGFTDQVKNELIGIVSYEFYDQNGFLSILLKAGQLLNNLRDNPDVLADHNSWNGTNLPLDGNILPDDRGHLFDLTGDPSFRFNAYKKVLPKAVNLLQVLRDRNLTDEFNLIFNTSLDPTTYSPLPEDRGPIMDLVGGYWGSSSLQNPDNSKGFFHVLRISAGLINFLRNNPERYDVWNTSYFRAGTYGNVPTSGNVTSTRVRNRFLAIAAASAGRINSLISKLQSDTTFLNNHNQWSGSSIPLSGVIDDSDYEQLVYLMNIPLYNYRWDYYRAYVQRAVTLLTNLQTEDQIADFNLIFNTNLTNTTVSPSLNDREIMYALVKSGWGHPNHHNLAATHNFYTTLKNTAAFIRFLQDNPDQREYFNNKFLNSSKYEHIPASGNLTHNPTSYQFMSWSWGSRHRINTLITKLRSDQAFLDNHNRWTGSNLQATGDISDSDYQLLVYTMYVPLYNYRWDYYRAYVQRAVTLLTNLQTEDQIADFNLIFNTNLTNTTVSPSLNDREIMYALVKSGWGHPNHHNLAATHNFYTTLKNTAAFIRFLQDNPDQREYFNNKFLNSSKYEHIPASGNLTHNPTSYQFMSWSWGSRHRINTLITKLRSDQAFLDNHNRWTGSNLQATGDISDSDYQLLVYTMYVPLYNYRWDYYRAYVQRAVTLLTNLQTEDQIADFNLIFNTNLTNTTVSPSLNDREIMYALVKSGWGHPNHHNLAATHNFYTTLKNTAAFIRFLQDNPDQREYFNNKFLNSSKYEHIPASGNLTHNPTSYQFMSWSWGSRHRINTLITKLRSDQAFLDNHNRWTGSNLQATGDISDSDYQLLVYTMYVPLYNYRWDYYRAYVQRAVTLLTNLQTEDQIADFNLIFNTNLTNTTVSPSLNDREIMYALVKSGWGHPNHHNLAATHNFYTTLKNTAAFIRFLQDNPDQREYFNNKFLNSSKYEHIPASGNLTHNPTSYQFMSWSWGSRHRINTLITKLRSDQAFLDNHNRWTGSNLQATGDISDSDYQLLVYTMYVPLYNYRWDYYRAYVQRAVTLLTNLQTEDQIADFNLIFNTNLTNTTVSPSLNDREIMYALVKSGWGHPNHHNLAATHNFYTTLKNTAAFIRFLQDNPDQREYFNNKFLNSSKYEHIPASGNLTHNPTSYQFMSWSWGSRHRINTLITKLRSDQAFLDNHNRWTGSNLQATGDISDSDYQLLVYTMYVPLYNYRWDYYRAYVQRAVTLLTNLQTEDQIADFNLIFNTNLTNTTVSPSLNDREIMYALVKSGWGNTANQNLNRSNNFYTALQRSAHIVRVLQADHVLRDEFNNTFFKSSKYDPIPVVGSVADVDTSMKLMSLAYYQTHRLVKDVLAMESPVSPFMRALDLTRSFLSQATDFVYSMPNTGSGSELVNTFVSLSGTTLGAGILLNLTGVYMNLQTLTLVNGWVGGNSGMFYAFDTTEWHDVMLNMMRSTMFTLSYFTNLGNQAAISSLQSVLDLLINIKLLTT